MSRRDRADVHLAPDRYFDRHFQIEAAKIKPGEYYVTPREMMIVTVLGSCVSACIRDRQRGIGGMNHFMLPTEDSSTDICSASARYGDYAMEILINELLKMGAQRHHLEAKIFGGGRVLKGFSQSNIGERNVDFVHRYLAKEEIPVIARDLLDIYPRKVYFFPQSGRVLVKKLRSMHNTTIFDRERDYQQRLSRTRIEGDVELF